MPNDHIVTSYDKELENLRSSIARMGGLAETQIAGAVDALFKRSAERAEQVVEADKALDDLEIAIERDAISILARRQPMASDLREIVSALKMSSVLERIGDYSKNIAKRVTAINESDNFRIVRTVGDMAHLVQKMLKDVLDAYIDQDAVKAMDVWERDAPVDELYNSLFRELLTKTDTVVLHADFAQRLPRWHLGQFAVEIWKSAPGNQHFGPRARRLKFQSVGDKILKKLPHLSRVRLNHRQPSRRYAG